MLVSAGLFETKQGVIRIFFEHSAGSPGRFPDARIERLIRPPETGPHARNHKRRGSSGSSGSVADSRRKASSRGRACVSASNRSQRSSSSRASRNLAKSITSDCFSGGSDSQTWMISAVAVLIVILWRQARFGSSGSFFWHEFVRRYMVEADAAESSTCEIPCLLNGELARRSNRASIPA